MEPIIYALLGLTIGAMAVFIVMTQMNRNALTEITRDASGHVISIYEKTL